MQTHDAYASKITRATRKTLRGTYVRGPQPRRDSAFCSHISNLSLSLSLSLSCLLAIFSPLSPLSCCLLTHVIISRLLSLSFSRSPLLSTLTAFSPPSLSLLSLSLSPHPLLSPLSPLSSLVSPFSPPCLLSPLFSPLHSVPLRSTPLLYFSTLPLHS